MSAFAEVKPCHCFADENLIVWGTQMTQNTQMNADLYFFSANRRSPLFPRASAPVCVVCVLLMQSLKKLFLQCKMIIYLSQGTQTTQNTQMNADLYFFSADRRSPLFSASLCANLRSLRFLLMQCAKFPIYFVLRTQRK